MNIDTLIAGLDAQVVAGEVLAVYAGKITVIGKLFDTEVILNEAGQELAAGLDTKPKAPRARRTAIELPVDEPPADAPVEPAADAPAPEAVAG